MALNLFYQMLDRLRTRTREERVREDRLRQEQTAERQERREKEQAAETVDFLLIVEAMRQAIEALSHVIEDAMQAVRLAYERAQAEHNAAVEALHAARENAVTLPDGRRVYFSADGAALYGEDHQLIADENVTAEARLRLAARPGSTTYETYHSAYGATAETAQRMTQLGEALNRLDELDRRLDGGEATENELAEVRRQARDIIDSLPQDVRDDVEVLQALRIGARGVPAHAIGQLAETAISLTDEFQSATTLASKELAAAQEATTEAAPARPSAYRWAPDF
jgi:hypothetical protein